MPIGGAQGLQPSTHVAGDLGSAHGLRVPATPARPAPAGGLCRFFCVTEVSKTSSACAGCTRRREQKLDPAQQCRDCSHISKRRRKQGIQVEIIQLVSIMYDASTHHVLGEFSSLLQPVHLPLTRFCTATTGITTKEAEAAEPLEQVLGSHVQWAASLIGPLEPMVLLTCGDFLCDALVPRQCERVMS